MLKKSFISIFLVLSVTVYAQQPIADSLAILFYNQLVVFPQEKIYLHTDKPCYITGEKIWFRAHLVDASTHIPSPVSRYVYVELFNPVDSLITRVKIMNDNDAYCGYIDIPEEIPDGDYLLRAYTKFMLNLDEHYLCTKTVHIGNPKNRQMLTDAKFSFDTDGKMNVDFVFSNLHDSTPIVPASVQMSINDGKKQQLKVQSDGTAGVSFKLPADATKRVMLLEMKDGIHSCRQYIPIPVSDNDFDVSFYPEGGHLLPGVYCRVAFKALMSDGRPADVEGIVYDQTGKEVERFQTQYLGMGSFMICPEADASYYAVIWEARSPWEARSGSFGQGQAQEQDPITDINSATGNSDITTGIPINQPTKRFDLPAALKSGYVLKTGTVKDNLYVSVLQSVPEGSKDTLFLLAHTRGEVHVIEPFDDSRKLFQFPQKLFPSGVLHLVLFDKNLHPVSERLVFINNDDQAQISCETKQNSFVARSLVENRVMLTDEDGSPLTGSFSVSVTDDSAVPLDTTANIMTQLLLTSDLRGHIENPAAYFNKEPSLATRSLDLLMLTQGWRRYDVSALAQNRPSHPVVPLELVYEITGRVKRLLVDKPVEKSKVTILSSHVDYIDIAETDKEGRFRFYTGYPPDSTTFIVQADPKSKKVLENLELLVDEEVFAGRTLPVVIPAEIEKEALEQYLEKAEQHNRKDDGMWSIDLSEVTITARKPLPKSVIRASYVLEEDEIQPIAQIRSTTMGNLLRRIPGVKVEEKGGEITNLEYHKAPFRMLTIDDETNPARVYKNENFRYVEEILNMINPLKVKTIYLTEVFMGMLVQEEPNPAPPITDLVIICNNVNDIYHDQKQYHIKVVQPLGYQQPVAFYAPKYDTPESKENTVYDLRTTIHWQPDVCTDSLGIASFDFYTAEVKSTYTMVIEGVTANGKIIRQESKLWK